MMTGSQAIRDHGFPGDVLKQAVISYRSAPKTVPAATVIMNFMYVKTEA